MSKILPNSTNKAPPFVFYNVSQCEPSKKFYTQHGLFDQHGLFVYQQLYAKVSPLSKLLLQSNAALFYLPFLGGTEETGVGLPSQDVLRTAYGYYIRMPELPARRKDTSGATRMPQSERA